MSDLYFRFGALSEKFSKQCENQGYKLKNAKTYDKLVDCAVMLHIHNILTDSRYDECLGRITQNANKDLKKLKGEQE